MLTVHKDRVWQVAKHPQFDLIVSVSADKTAHIFNLEGKPLKTIDDVHDRSIRSAAWRPRIEQLALGSFDSTISVFAFESPNWEFIAQLEGPENEVKKINWSHDGNYLASCSRDKSVWIWEIDEEGEDFECVAVLQEHEQDVKHVAWHPQTNLLASASYDDTVLLWRQDVDEWICVSKLQNHKSTVWMCSFHFEDMRLVTCSADLEIRIFNKTSETGGSQAQANDALGTTNSSAWDVLSEVWELECCLPKVHTQCIYSVEWSPMGILSAGADGRIVVYRENKDHSFYVHHVIEMAHGVYEINTATWCGNTNQVISGGDDGIVKLWDIPA